MPRPALPVQTLEAAPPPPRPEPGSPMPAPDLLRPGRVHEAAGAARRVFAAAFAGRLTGPVLWVQESRAADRLCPPGLATFFDPARLILLTPVGEKAVLQVLEEALRSGAAPLVVGELSRPPDLTAGRRLQLAAGTGRVHGLMLVPETAARAGTAETRWHCRPLPGEAGAPQLWELIRDKRGRPGRWQVGARDPGRGFRVEASCPETA